MRNPNGKAATRPVPPPEPGMGDGTMLDTCPSGDTLGVVASRLEDHLRAYRNAAEIQDQFNTALATLLFTLIHFAAHDTAANRSRIVLAVNIALDAMGERHRNGLCGVIMRSALASLRNFPNDAGGGWPAAEGGKANDNGDSHGSL